MGSDCSVQRIFCIKPLFNLQADEIKIYLEKTDIIIYIFTVLPIKLEMNMINRIFNP